MKKNRFLNWTLPGVFAVIGMVICVRGLHLGLFYSAGIVVVFGVLFVWITGRILKKKGKHFTDPTETTGVPHKR
ncbi:MAG TPA: hypothetical protein VFW05_11870 [Verrucomicrobiae bacterium]|nr:hypothetical protein [Verrucomicrobiae bacterium]